MQVLNFLTSEIEVVTLPPEGNDEMAGPTHKERLDGIDDRLAAIDIRLDRIDAALGLKPAPLKKNRWERSKDWMRANPWVAWPLAVTLALVTLFGGYWLNHRREWWNHDVDERARAVLNEKDGVNETLHRMEQTVNRTEAKLETLEPFIHDVIQHQFDSAAKLPTAELQQRLPAVQHLLAAAKNQEIKAGPKVLDALTQKLSVADTTAIGFWPTAAEFISYRSFSNSGSALTDLQTCTDHEPSPMKVLRNTEHSITLGFAVYENCEFALDSSIQDGKINDFLWNKYVGITFRNCLITYRGGWIKLVLSLPHRSIKGLVLTNPHDPRKTENLGDFRGDSEIYSTLKFEKCQFDFLFTGPPAGQGQELTKSLLASNNAIVNLSFRKPVEPPTHN